ncbi:histidine kinase, partial [Streptomyces sp. AcH 505]
DRSALPVPPQPDRNATSVDPAALPGNGSRVVARPTGERAGDGSADDSVRDAVGERDTARRASEREDTTRGR